MPTANFHFPAQSGTYDSPVGQVYIKIYYEDDANSNTDSNVKLHRLGKMRFPFEVDPAQQKFRLSDFTLSFFNDNDFFETSGVLNEAKRDITYMLIEIDGVTKWHGRLILSSTKKKGYYKQGSSYTYSLITLKFEDKMSILKRLTLNDIAYWDGMTVYGLLEYIGYEYNVSLNVDSDYYIEESNGRRYSIVSGYDGQFKITGLDTNLDLLTVLKKLCLSFGFRAFTWDDQLNFVPLSGMGAVSLSDYDVFRFEGKVDYDNIVYVKISSPINWAYTPASVFGLTTDEVNEYGRLNEDENRNFIYDASDVLSNVYIELSDSDKYFPDSLGDYPTSASNTYIIYSAGGLYGTRFVESGMLLDIAPESIITDCPLDTKMEFYDNGDRTYEDLFRVDRWADAGATGQKKLYKVHKLSQKTGAIYNAYFLNGGEYRIVLHGFDHHLKEFNYISKRFAPKKVTINFSKNETSLIVREVG